MFALFCFCLTNYLFWRNGARKCQTMYLYGDMYYDCKANCLDVFFYSSLWFSSSRRCTIYDVGICNFHVAISGYTCNNFGKNVSDGTDCSMDWYVYRLDDSRSYLFIPFSQQEMAESSDNLEEFFIEKQRIKKQYI